MRRTPASAVAASDMWPFTRRTETRAVDYTSQTIEAGHEFAAGETPDASTLAAVEACRGLWERAFSAATVGPAVATLEGVTPEVLGLTGRGLATSGECVFLIAVQGGQVMLHPASTFDVRGGHDSWVYRVDLIGPNDTLSLENVPAAQVLHFRINASLKSPWRGRSPLSLAGSTAGLAARLERALHEEQEVPIKRFLPVAAHSAEQIADVARSLKERLSRIVVLSASPLRHDNQPVTRHSAARIGPEVEPGTVQLREALRTDILSAYGIPPGLFDTDSDAVGQRELWRRFCYSVIGPIGRCIRSELRLKLDPGATLEFDDLRAADIEGRARALRGRAQAAATLAALEGVDLDRALRLAGLDGMDD